MFCKPPPTVPSYCMGNSKLEVVDAELACRDEILNKLRAKLLKAKEVVKYVADQKHVPASFKLGDHVMVKLCPYRQYSLSGPQVQKLSKRYYGPFEIIECIGDVAFHLALSPTTKLHHIFHASLLKPFTSTTPLSLPPCTTTTQPIVRPLAIVAVDDNSLCVLGVRERRS